MEFKLEDYVHFTENCELDFKNIDHERKLELRDLVAIAYASSLGMVFSVEYLNKHFGSVKNIHELLFMSSLYGITLGSFLSRENAAEIDDKNREHMRAIIPIILSHFGIKVHDEAFVNDVIQKAFNNKDKEE